ncbi:MAG TPA: diguanylate cyclase, partial [Dehalococcoidia bacterium]|nr:diguanylate cyclase [Dehalococcoidia bacterium]
MQTTPSGHSPAEATPEEEHAAQLRRLRQFLAWLVPTIFGFALLCGVLMLALRDPVTGGTGAVLLGYGLTLRQARRHVAAGRAEAAVALICAGLLAGDLLVTLFEPALLPSLGIAPMLAVVVALPYLNRRRLGLLIVFCIAQAVAVMLLGEYLRLVPQPAAWLASILRILSLSTVLAMAMFLLWQFSSRLTETLAQTRAARAELQAQHERLSVTLDSIGDGVIVTDQQGRITRLNPVAEALTGWSQADAAGRPFAEVFRVVGEETRGPAADPVAKALDSGAIVELANHMALIARDGSERSIANSAAPIRDATGQIHGAVVVFRDQTEARRVAARVAYLADHDPLTGLVNRRRFGEELDRALQRAAETGSGGAVLLCDLDGFKAVNDSLGHRAGDELLCEVAAMLGRVLRDGDLLARLGGDEFAVLLPGYDAGGARRMAERLTDELRHARFAALGQPVRITASIGGALFPEHGSDRDELLIHADLAMYRVKERGRDGVS